MAVSLDLSDVASRDRPGAGRPPVAEKPGLIGLTRAQLGDALRGAGVPDRQVRMRVQQLWHWLYVRGVSDFDQMTNVSKDLRALLGEKFSIARPEIVEEQISNDGTRKWLLRFPPRGAGRPVEVETVYIPEEGRGTLCISSQVGCTLTCTFCHTGTQKLVRNLTSEEIIAQLLLARERLGDFPDSDTPQGAIVPAEGRKVSNIVMMGMGEPLYNFDNVRDALLVAADGDGLSLSKAPDHAVDLRRGAADRADGRGDRRHAGDLAACRHRRTARRAGADQQEVSARRTARCLPPIRACRTPGASPSNM